MDSRLCRAIWLVTNKTPANLKHGTLPLGRITANGAHLLRFTGLVAIAYGFPHAIAKSQWHAKTAPRNVT